MAPTNDMEYLMCHAAFTGYQYSSLFTPLVYTFFTVKRRGGGNLAINNALRATWIGGIVGATCMGSLMYARHIHSTDESIRARRIAITYDARRVRTNDHAAIGAFLGAVLVPAILWKRARTVNLILGGAGIGSATGLLTYHCHNLASKSGAPT